MKILHRFVFSIGLVVGASAHAQLKIEISGISSNQIPVAIAAFGDENVSSEKISEIIKADLTLSGASGILVSAASIRSSPLRPR